MIADALLQVYFFVEFLDCWWGLGVRPSTRLLGSWCVSSCLIIDSFLGSRLSVHASADLGHGVVTMLSEVRPRDDGFRAAS